MKRTIEFGKIDYNHSGIKNCLVTVEVELRDRAAGPEFTVCGEIWNPKRTDIYAGGQCLDTIAEYVKDLLFEEIYQLWQQYHLNTMHPGTEAQEEALKLFWAECESTDYEKDCEYLKSIGLYEDNGYRYGTAWLYRAIPEETLERIREIISAA